MLPQTDRTQCRDHAGPVPSRPGFRGCLHGSRVTVAEGLP